jgi:RHH-type proline utilization regulon transcriptional repressor/proline dehydrogenase/delta 1-pyrroline-5-carboxylate dehydrogenase
VDYGLTAGIHSLNKTEVRDWLSRVQAGNLYVNRGITGAIVQRQPFGGWKRSTVGPSAKAGGPNYLISLSDWEKAAAADHDIQLTDAQNSVLSLAASSAMTDSEVESLLRAAKSDIWNLQNFFRSTDESGLNAERNVLRYFRSDCTLRVDLSASNYDSWRAMLALIALGKGDVSAFDLPARLKKEAQKAGLKVTVEDAQRFHKSLLYRPRRVRYIGQPLTIETGSVLASCDIAMYSSPATESGRIELLPYFKEQAVSVTAHRFGNPVKFVAELAL